MVEHKRATNADGDALRALFGELVDLKSPNLSEDDCRTALTQVENLVSTLVADDNSEGRLWLDVPGALSVLKETHHYAQNLWGKCRDNNMTAETEQAAALADRCGARLGAYDETMASGRLAINEAIASGNVVVPHRKTRHSVDRILGRDQQQ